MVWRHGGRGGDADVAGPRSALQGSARRNTGRARWRVADARSGGSGGGDWVWRGPDRVPDFGGWRLWDQYDFAVGCSHGEECAVPSDASGCFGAAYSYLRVPVLAGGVLDSVEAG